MVRQARDQTQVPIFYGLASLLSWRHDPAWYFREQQVAWDVWAQTTAGYKARDAAERGSSDWSGRAPGTMLQRLGSVRRCTNLDK